LAKLISIILGDSTLSFLSLQPVLRQGSVVESYGWIGRHPAIPPPESANWLMDGTSMLSTKALKASAGLGSTRPRTDASGYSS
jgi:hypothetical protein